MYCALTCSAKGAAPAAGWDGAAPGAGAPLVGSIIGRISPEKSGGRLARGGGGCNAGGAHLSPADLIHGPDACAVSDARIKAAHDRASWDYNNSSTGTTSPLGTVLPVMARMKPQWVTTAVWRLSGSA